MSILSQKSVNDALVPIPPAGKINVFLSSIDNKYKGRKDDGSYVSFEDSIVASGDAENITYFTNDVALWDWNGIVPTNVEIALDELAGGEKELFQLVNMLLPAKASALGTPTISGTILYSGKLPSGLSAAWYTELPAGSVITSAVYDNIFDLIFLGFKSGKAGQPATYGIASIKIDGVTTDSYDMTAGPGTSGVITISNIQVHNTFWSKADFLAAITQLTEGLKTYQLEHTEAGLSTLVKIYYDNNIILPAFSVAPSLAINTKVSKWLSGIEYFGFGTILEATYTVVDLFRKVYMASGATQISCIGMNPFNVDPAVTPAYTASFLVASKQFTLDKADESSIAPELNVTARKPNNLTAAVANVDVKATLGYAIDTYGTPSTPTSDIFHDEAQRLIAGTLTPFVSTTPLVNGEAQVVAGTLFYGDIDYPAKTGDQRYDRFISKPISNSGTLQFGNIIFTDISPYGTGDLNILLHLTTDDKYFDLGRPFGSNNGTGLGNNLANSIGGRVVGSGASVDFTFGTFSTADNGDKFRLIVIFRNNLKVLTSVISI